MSDTMRSKEFFRTISTAATLLVVATTSIPSISRIAFIASHILDSSSTTSALSLSIDRHLHGKCRPLSHNALDLDVSTMFFNNTITYGQAEARSFRRVLGRKKGVKYLAQILRSYSCSRIADDNPHKLVHNPGRHL